MTSSLRSLPFAALLLLPATAVAQGVTFDRCDTPRVPLGVLAGEGRVRYRVLENGHPDTASVEVLAVRGLSVGGYRSAVVRVLADCRMKRLHDAPDGVRVSQAIAFVRNRANTITQLTPPGPVDPADIPLPGGPRLVRGGDAAALDDSLVEEHPRPLSCNDALPSAGSSPPSGPFRSEAEANAAFADWARLHNGRARLLVVVGIDGQVARDQVSVVDSDNPTVTNDMIKGVAGCHYAPGRIGGEPVPTRVVQGRGVEYRTEP